MAELWTTKGEKVTHTDSKEMNGQKLECKGE
jgi:hypothetical protein